MSAHLASVTRRSRADSLRGSQCVRGTLAVSAVALAVGLLSGCDGTASAAATPTGPGASAAVSADAAAAFDNVGSLHGDEAGVAAVVAAWDAAWNAGDAAALAARFVDDAEFINGRGQIASGAAEIRANHTVSLAGVFRGSHTQGHIRHIVFLSGTTAVVDSDGDLTGFHALPPGVEATAPGLLRSRQKRVVVKRDGTWRVVLMQLTSVAPTP